MGSKNQGRGQKSMMKRCKGFYFPRLVRQLGEQRDRGGYTKSGKRGECGLEARVDFAPGVGVRVVVYRTRRNNQRIRVNCPETRSSLVRITYDHIPARNAKVTGRHRNIQGLNWNPGASTSTYFPPFPFHCHKVYDATEQIFAT